MLNDRIRRMRLNSVTTSGGGLLQGHALLLGGGAKQQAGPVDMGG